MYVIKDFKRKRMTLLHNYLSSPKVKKTLNCKPGEEGFSLIELVVVVAVLAILAAIAIPSFTSIQDNAAQAAAKNTIATIVKECAVKTANMEANPTFVVPQLNSYTVTPANGLCSGNTSSLDILATRIATAPTTIPQFIRYYQSGTNKGQKACTVGTKAEFCVNSKW